MKRGTVAPVLASTILVAAAGRAQPVPEPPHIDDVGAPRTAAAADGQPAPQPAAEEDNDDEERLRYPDTVRLVLGAGGHVAFDAAPSVAAGLHIAVELARRAWSLGLEGRYDLPASAASENGSWARSSLAGASFVPCLRVRFAYVCAVLQLARVHAEGATGGGASVSDPFLFVGLGGRLAVHAALPLGLTLRVDGETLVHPATHTLSADGVVLFTTRPVSMSIGPGIVKAF